MQKVFTDWCEAELFSPAVIRATAILNRFCDLHLAGLFRALDLRTLLAQPRTASELARMLRFVDSANITLEAMLERLAERVGIVAVDRTSGVSKFQALGTPPDPSAELGELRREAASLGADCSAATEFLDFGAEHFVEALRDDPDLLDKVLSGRDGGFFELWVRATNVDPLQDLHGKMGARAVADVFERGTILEIGGGTGNGIRHLFALLEGRNALDRVDGYIFTDISMRFILETRRAISQQYPSVHCKWAFLDINKPFEAQKIGPESVDLVYGVNAAHVAQNIVGFLGHCRQTLKPRGRVVFAERIRMRPREMAPRELTLNLSVYHRTAAERDPLLRPTHCYLAPEHWLAALEKAGFREPMILPDLKRLEEKFPEQYAAVVVAAK